MSKIHKMTHSMAMLMLVALALFVHNSTASFALHGFPFAGHSVFANDAWAAPHQQRRLHRMHLPHHRTPPQHSLYNRNRIADVRRPQSRAQLPRRSFRVMPPTDDKLAYVLKIDAPGTQRHRWEIRVDAHDRLLVNERGIASHNGGFHRVFEIPKTVDQSRISGHWNGARELWIYLPLLQEPVDECDREVRDNIQTGSDAKVDGTVLHEENEVKDISANSGGSSMIGTIRRTPHAGVVHPSPSHEPSTGAQLEDTLHDAETTDITEDLREPNVSLQNRDFRREQDQEVPSETAKPLETAIETPEMLREQQIERERALLQLRHRAEIDHLDAVVDLERRREEAVAKEQADVWEAIDQERLEQEALWEAINELRGEREEPGIREEWTSKDYLKQDRYDVYEHLRKPARRFSRSSSVDASTGEDVVPVKIENASLEHAAGEV